jgi:tRNA-guanine family transglycosylase
MSVSLLFWIGECSKPLKYDRSGEMVTDSTINYYKAASPRLTYNPGKILLDCGAFTASKKGMVLEPFRVLEVQEKLGADVAIPLDYPFLPGFSESLMRKRWEMTASNILFWQSSGNFREGILPVLHSWDRTSLKENVRWLQHHVDAEYIALGTLVTPRFSSYSGFFGDRQPRRELIDMISLAISEIKSNTEFKIHLTGLGSSPLMLHLAYYLGITSTDSAGARRKAAYGKIILPGKGERHISNKAFSFGRSRLSNEDIQLLENCDCSICRENRERLYIDWKARALHNEYVLKKEVEKAKKLLDEGLDFYERYLNQIYQRSSLNYLYRYAKLHRRCIKLDKFLF